MNNAFSKSIACLAVVIAVGNWWQVATGDPQPPIRIGEGAIKNNGRPEMLMQAKVELLVSRMEKLEAENQALKKQMSQLQSDVQKNTDELGITKLLLSGLDKSVGKLDKDYRNHTHEMGFGFSNPATITNSKSNILIPWISSGQLKSGANFRTSLPH